MFKCTAIGCNPVFNYKYLEQVVQNSSINIRCRLSEIFRHFYAYFHMLNLYHIHCSICMLIISINYGKLSFHCHVYLCKNFPQRSIDLKQFLHKHYNFYVSSFTNYCKTLSPSCQFNLKMYQIVFQILSWIECLILMEKKQFYHSCQIFHWALMLSIILNDS